MSGLCPATFSLRDKMRSFITCCCSTRSMSQLRSFRNMNRMPQRHLPLEVFRAHPAGIKPKPHWRGYICLLAWERLGIPYNELGKRMSVSLFDQLPQGLISVKLKTTDRCTEYGETVLFLHLGTAEVSLSVLKTNIAVWKCS